MTSILQNIRDDPVQYALTTTEMVTLLRGSKATAHAHGVCSQNVDGTCVGRHDHFKANDQKIRRAYHKFNSHVLDKKWQ